MPRFVFKAKNSMNELVEGSRNSNSERELVSALKSEGLIVFLIKEVGESAAASSASRGGERGRKSRGKRGKVKHQDVAVFCRQLCTLVNAGVSILDGIEDVSEMVSNDTFKKILKGIATDIRGGSTLSDAMKKHQKVFGKVLIYMVAAGEKSGKLGKILQDMAAYLENVVKLKRKVVAASVYPIFVGVFFVVILAGITLFLIPRFASMFASFGAELPLPTKIVMGVSNLAVRNVHWVILGMIGTVTGTSFAYRTTPGKMFIDGLKLKLPIFGMLMTKVIFARFFQTLSTLIRSGIDVVSALDIAAKVADNLPVELMVTNIKSRVVEGSTLSREMEKLPLFPKMVVRMTAVGEKSGKLDEMFSKLSDYYSDEVDAAVAAMSSIIEPLLIMMLGVIVGVVVVSMYLPIFKMVMAVMGKN